MINKVVLLGNLTRDPEIRYGQQPNPDGSQNIIARYTLAVNRSRRKDTEEQTDFISCVAFGRSAEFAQKYLKKGTRICVTGRLQTGSYVRQDGVRVYTTDVVIENQEFAGRRPDDSTAQTQQPAQTQAPVQAQPAPAPQYAGAPQYAAAPQNAAPATPAPAATPTTDQDGFMTLPEEAEEDLPFV